MTEIDPAPEATDFNTPTEFTAALEAWASVRTCCSCGRPLVEDTFYKLQGPLGFLYAHERCLESAEAD